MNGSTGPDYDFVYCSYINSYQLQHDGEWLLFASKHFGNGGCRGLPWSLRGPLRLVACRCCIRGSRGHIATHRGMCVWLSSVTTAGVFTLPVGKLDAQLSQQRAIAQVTLFRVNKVVRERKHAFSERRAGMKSSTARTISNNAGNRNLRARHHCTGSVSPFGASLLSLTTS